MPTKVPIVKAIVFPGVVYGCESWAMKAAEHLRIATFELWCWRRFESPLDSKETKPVNPKGSQPWMFIGMNDTEAEFPITTLATWCEELTHWKRPRCWENWRQEEKGMTEDEMAEWHHWLKGHEFERTLGDHEEQERLACCSPRPWSGREPYTT